MSMNRRFMEGLPQDKHLREAVNLLAEAFFSQYPMGATDLGLHDWDNLLTDLSPPRQDAYLRQLRQAQQRLNQVNPVRLALDDKADHAVLTNALALAIDEQIDEPVFTRDPNFFNRLISGAILTLGRRKFGTESQRAKAVAARLAQVPRLLQQAETLLENPPRLFVQIARQQYAQTLPFLSDAIRPMFPSVDSIIGSRLDAEIQKSVDAYRKFLDYLEALEPRSNGDYALGAKRYANRLQWQEHIHTPLDQLLQAGYTELDRLHEELAKAVTQEGSGRELSAILAAMAQQHPASDHLLAEAANVLDDLRQFVLNRRLVSIPPGSHPLVVETPAYMRAITFASIDPPGPFEEEATDAYYQITLPDPEWSPQEQHQHLSTYTPWSIRIISAHEVYPGHYVQYLHLPRCRSTVRRMIASGAFVEGWAHYTEELLIEQGYHNHDPQMRIAQILDALLRVGRMIVGIRLHTHDISFDEAQHLFEQECFMPPLPAQRETIRGTMDPFYLIYTLGKLQIKDLRQEAERQWGSRFSLQAFHDRMLDHGYPPIPIVRELLLGVPLS